MDLNKTASQILNKIKSSNSFLIIASKPVDFDCMGTALATKWWLNKLGKNNTRVVTFNWKNDLAEIFPDSDQIEFIYPDKVDYEEYDCIILLDSSDWQQFFTEACQNYTTNIPKEKFINIDHHTPGSVKEDLGDFAFNKKDCCTAKVLYDYFIKPSKFELDSQLAQWLYMALMGDTGRFMYAIFTAETYDFAKTLYEVGVDHDMAVDFSISKQAMDFTVWAIEHTKYYDHIGLTVLNIDEKLNDEIAEKFGKDWQEKSLHKYYQNVFMRTVKGYPYAVDLWYTNGGGTKIGWRTKNGAPIEIMEVFRAIGIDAGGHRNAGGGKTKDMSVSEVEEKFVAKMKEF